MIVIDTDGLAMPEKFLIPLESVKRD